MNVPFFIHMSPGSLPIHGIFDANMNKDPRTTKIIPEKIKILPKLLMSDIFYISALVPVNPAAVK